MDTEFEIIGAIATILLIGAVVFAMGYGIGRQDKAESIHAEMTAYGCDAYVARRIELSRTSARSF